MSRLRRLWAGRVSVQLQFDFDALSARLADDLKNRRRVPTGAETLLRRLVLRGLDEQALTAAAALVLELEREIVEAA